MYAAHYGFRERPFDVTPDPRYLYLSPGHREVLSTMVYGIRERRGFIVTTGEVGTGKTTLIHATLDRLQKGVKTAYLFNTSLDFDELLNTILVELDIQGAEECRTRDKAFRCLNQCAIDLLSAGGNLVLILDEAQNLDFTTMENLRLLSNLETRRQKLIQIILAGQPELDMKLRDPRLRQLTERICLRRTIAPLTHEEFHEYIAHRLKVAGYGGGSLFARKALENIWQWSRGIPRRINILCDNALLIGQGMGRTRITHSMIAEAVDDLGWARMGSGCIAAKPQKSRALHRTGRPYSFPLAAAGLLLLVFIFLFSFTRSGVFKPVIEDAGNAADQSNRFPPEPRKGVYRSLVPAPEAAPALGGGDLPASLPQQDPATPVVDRALSQETSSALPGLPDEEEKQVTVAGDLRASRPQQDPGNPIGDRELPQETSSTLQGLPDAEEPKQVTVAGGQTLAGIIRARYRRCDDKLLAAVLEKNPGIRNPDRIWPGEKITLPGFD